MSELLHAPTPERVARTQLTAFARFLERRTGRTFPAYRDLHAYTITERAAFWSALLDWSGALAEGERTPALVGEAVETARFFPGLRLSWAENLLAPGDAAAEAAPALVACDEGGGRTELSRAALRRRVRALAAALQARGLTAGDRVVAVARNNAESIVACLAVTSLGAAWSSVAPDMGLDAALGRFTQLQPRLLFAHRATTVNGARVVPQLDRLTAGLPSLALVVGLDGELDAAVTGPVPGASLEALEAEGARLPAAEPGGPWLRFPFDQPLFILFSSGTTGPPKCIVHGHGGTLLEHLKELRLHCDLGPADRLLFQTSTGWMMWNWMVTVLAAGSCLVTYDGSVSYPEPDALLQVLARERVTAFGTSPAYLQYLCDAGVAPQPGSLSALRELYSTGSVLYPHLHRWAREHLADAPLQSISGGTDIVGCFVQGQPWGEVHAGESTCLGLGLDVRAWTPEGLVREGRGELVCAAPFPSRPVGLFGDPDGARFHRAYFAQHDGLWTHGDLVELLPSGAARILGRCDGILNIRGIRIGPGEIYGVLADAVPEVAFAMAADQEAPQEPGGRRLVLLLVLKPGLKLDRALAMRVKKALKQRASAAHVPAVLLQVEELPTTFSGKRSEAALQDALSGRQVRNRAALRNPACLDVILADPALRTPGGGGG